MTKLFETPQDLYGSEGTHLGPTDWLTMKQDRIDGFANCTDDHQWIHVDSERALDGPYGSTIAHGYLTLSLVNRFLPELINIQGFRHAVNVGCDKVRFLNVVRCGAKIRGIGEILEVEDKKGAVQARIRVSIEIEGEDRPACVVETISRYFSE